MSATGTLAVTGASGVIGRHFCEHFRERGWRVRALVRERSRAPLEKAGFETFRCDLPEDVDRAGLEGADVVVHCAYATRATSEEAAQRVNESGTRALASQARACGVRRFVFLSSVSARADAPAYYGRSKAALEQEFDPARDLILRPGLVLARGGGLFDRMCTSIARSRFVPVFGGGRQVLQTVHVADLCDVLERALALDRAGTWNVVAREGIEMREFVRAIAARLDRRCTLVPLPFTPVLAALRVTEALRVPAPIHRENLLGLRAMRPVEPAPELEALGVRLRGAEESLDDLLGGRA